MEIGWLTNSSLTRLLRRFLPPKPPRSEGVRVRVTQTGPIFRLPNELFLDILSHFPVVDYLDYYLRAQLVPLRRPKLPKVYYWWFTALASLTSTCWDMRLKLLPVLWGRIQTYVEVGSFMDYESKMPQLLLMRCAILSKTPSIAVHVKVLSVSLTFHGWHMESSLSSFVGCLYALPNLHTLEIVYCLSGRYPAGVKRAFAAVSLPNILTLTVHSRAGDVIKACPNVKEVTLICGGSNIPDSVVELLADMRHTIRRIAVLHGSPAGVAKLAERFPTLGELSLRQPDPQLLSAVAEFVSLRTLELVLLPSPKAGADPERMWPRQVQAAVDVVGMMPTDRPRLVRVRKVHNIHPVCSTWWEMEKIWV